MSELWWQGPVRCRLCGHRSHAVVEVESEEDDVLTRLECSHCGNSTMQPVVDDLEGELHWP